MKMGTIIYYKNPVSARAGENPESSRPPSMVSQFKWFDRGCTRCMLQFGLIESESNCTESGSQKWRQMLWTCTDHLLFCFGRQASLSFADSCGSDPDNSQSTTTTVLQNLYSPDADKKTNIFPSLIQIKIKSFQLFFSLRNPNDRPGGEERHPPSVGGLTIRWQLRSLVALRGLHLYLERPTMRVGPTHPKPTWSCWVMSR